MSSQLTTEQAIAFGESKAWESLTARQRAALQLHQDRLCMPFDVFHQAIEEALGRPVWTHELGLNRDGLKQELAGESQLSTMAEILALIPEEKRVIIIAAREVSL